MDSCFTRSHNTGNWKRLYTKIRGQCLRPRLALLPGSRSRAFYPIFNMEEEVGGGEGYVSTFP